MTATDQQPEDGQPKSRTIPLPSRDSVTAMQVQTLLHAAQTLNSLVVSRGATEDYGGIKDGGVAAAVDSTIIRICAQLDTMVDDSSRWSLTSQGKLEDQLKRVYAANLDVLRVQKEAVIKTSSPHMLAGAKLLKVEDGTWIAFLGDPRDLDNCIVGIGEFPAEALRNFDEVFRGAKNKLINENEKLGSGRTDASENPPSGAQDVGGNREDNGEDGGISPSKD